ncbi:MAG TPA: biotin carboxylase [Clostridiales bacterium]|nr:biotin carboxylase [Clostridiales bacterium]
MSDLKIPRRVSSALLNSISAGVTPRIGLEYMAVGRREEIGTLLDDLANVAEGGSVFRFIVGRYGSGKSFLLQIIRNYAMDRNYAVADADLSPERKLTGGSGHGLNTYRELIRNLSTRVRPDGGALPALLEKWISGIQVHVLKELSDEKSAAGKAGEARDTGEAAGEAASSSAQAEVDLRMEARILREIHQMDTLVHGFDFAKVLTAYWRGWKSGSDELRSAALKWLRGEYTTRSEAHAELGVRSIIGNDTWFDDLRLISAFARTAGCTGFLVLLDEGVNLYKISNSQSRNNNYEKLLNMFNDAMQGKMQGIGIYMGGTPQFVEDPRRGLFSYEALRTRLVGTRYVREGFRDLQSPLLTLDKLSHEELFVLLKKVLEIHCAHHQSQTRVTDHDLMEFLQLALSRLGAEELLTPREVLRDFVGILNVLLKEPDISFQGLLTGNLFHVSSAGEESRSGNDGDGEAVEFTL